MTELLLNHEKARQTSPLFCEQCDFDLSHVLFTHIFFSTKRFPGEYELPGLCERKNEWVVYVSSTQHECMTQKGQYSICFFSVGVNINM